MRAVVLVLPKSGYRNDDFLAAAHKLGLSVIAASDVCHQLAEGWEEAPLALRFRDAQAAADELAQQVAEQKPVAVLGVDDLTALVAALAAEKLGLPHNPPRAVAAARNKAQSRAALRDAGLPAPRFEAVSRDLAGAELDALLARAPYPCVVKPVVLSGSRGVIRADDAAGLRAAFQRVAALLRSPEVAERRDPDLARILIEEFIPGPEVALEGMLMRGHLHVLALFDKPDPLDGPYFEETLYVTPSRHPAPLQDAVARAVSDGCKALGLSEGPVHGELRLSPAGPRVLEIAARSIGGLCGRALRFGVGVTLEELILRHALGTTAEPPPRERRAAGVLMLPIRKRGVLEEVRGVEEARRVPLIEDVAITAHLREELVPLPEGASYLGFAFARGASPEQVEAALRKAGAKIDAVVTPKLPLQPQGAPADPEK
ncbi:MAG TPA: ATP-grasp domain-containing protein [Myxococcales bacterium]|nr:ATP-grasp domain-containing protein [Myxococcales bacterium]